MHGQVQRTQEQVFKLDRNGQKHYISNHTHYNVTLKTKQKQTNLMSQETQHPAMIAAENWHKEHSSAGNIDKVKELLKEEYKDNFNANSASVFPILHNKGKICLQFCGWSINLLDDGTWHWEATDGG